MRLKRFYRTYSHTIFVLCLCECMGCSAVSKPVDALAFAKRELSLEIMVDPYMNNRTPTRVDIVVVNDKATYALVKALQAKDWFEQATNLLRMNPGKLHVTRNEWVPGEVVAPLNIADTRFRTGVFLFVDYNTPGEHRALLPKVGNVKLTLGPDDFTLIPRDGPVTSMTP